MPVPAEFPDMWSTDRDLQNKAYTRVLAETAEPVDWAYEVWDELLARLTDKDNHCRSIAAQVLSRLAKSDPDGRLFDDFDALFAVTKDPRFVTARHAMQSLWRVGTAGEPQRRMMVDALRGRFAECTTHKNCTLIRYDIIVSLRKLFDATGDDAVKAAALELIATEDDLKYRKKYAGVWRDA